MWMNFVQVKNEFDIVYSGDCKDKSRRVVLSQYLKYQLQNEKNYNVITKNKCMYFLCTINKWYLLFIG